MNSLIKCEFLTLIHKTLTCFTNKKSEKVWDHNSSWVLLIGSNSIVKIWKIFENELIATEMIFVEHYSPGIVPSP